MKLSLLILSFLFSFNTAAHDNPNECNVQLKADLALSPKTISFHLNHEELYRIENDSSLIIEEQTIILSKQQIKKLSDFSQSIRALVPEVKGLAIETVQLAKETTHTALGELLGENSPVVYNLLDELYLLEQKIDHIFSPDGTLYIDKEGQFIESFFTDNFEKQIESSIETALENSMGSIIQHVLFSNGGITAFEERMENLAHHIESTVEIQAQLIEKKAEKLCYQVIDINTLEEELKLNISELAVFDVISFHR